MAGCRRDYGNPVTHFRLLQISDCHLSASAGTLYRGKEADAGIRSLLPSITAWKPDLLLATGDLSEDASEASYQRLHQYLQDLSVVRLGLPGNHDEPAKMRVHFPQGPWDGPLIWPAGAWRLALLKSSAPRRIDGALDPADLRRLGAWLQSPGDYPVLIALHHQPVAVGSPWIDRHMLEAPEGLLQLVRRHERVRGVVWGHVHQSYESRLGAARMLGCPSTASNSLPDREKFTEDPAGPACRWLELHSDGTLETGLLRVQSRGRTSHKTR